MGGMAAKRYYFLRASTFFLGFGIAISISGADLVLQKVPPLTVAQAPNYPQNLARFDLGAQIGSDVPDDGSSSVPFLSGDPASVYGLRTGTTRLLISLAQIENIDSIAFLNSEAKGTVTIAMSSAKLSPESPQWHDAGQEELSNGLISARIGPAEAKYVRLTFNVRSPGRIFSLGIYSAAPVSDFTMPRARKIAAASSADAKAKANYNLADLHAKARTIFVSSGHDLRLAYNMIDGQPGTAYGFAASDAARAAIIDLGHSVSVNRISTFSTPGSATVTFYLIGALLGNNTGKISNRACGSIHRRSPHFGRSAPAMMMEVVGSRSISRKPPVAMSCWYGHRPRGMQISLSLKLLSSAQPATRGCWRQILLETTLPILRTARLSAIRRMQKISERISAGDSGGRTCGRAGPGEGPATELPRPPPFVFIPRVVPTSP